MDQSINKHHIRVLASLAEIGNMGRKTAGVIGRKVGSYKITEYHIDELNSGEVTYDAIADMVFYMYHNNNNSKDYLKEAKETEIEYRKRNKLREMGYDV